MPQQAKTREKRKSGITSSHIFHGCTRQGTSFSSPVVLSLPKTSVSVTKSTSSGDLGSAADTSGVSQSRTRSARLSLSTTPEVSAKNPVKRTLDLSSQKLACVPSKQRKMSYSESVSAESEECVETRLNKEASDSANTSKLQDLLSNIQCLQSSPKSPHQTRSRKAETTNFVVHTDTPSTRTPAKLVSKEKNLKPLKISQDQRQSERLVEIKYSQLNTKAADVMKKESPTAQCEDNEILVGKKSSELSPATHRHVTRVRSTKITSATYNAQVDAAESCRISDFAKPATDLAKCHPPVDITTGDRAVHIKTDTLEAFTETDRVKSPQSRASAAESGTGIAKSSKVEAEIVKLNTKYSGCDDTHLSRKNSESTATPGFDGAHSAKTKSNNVETYSGEAITKSVTANNTVEEISVQKSTLAVANTIKSDTKDVDNTQFTAITDFSVSSTDDLDLSDSATTVHHVADAMIVKSPVQSIKQESGMVESRTEFTKSTPSDTVKSLLSPVTKTEATREDVEADAACSFINISFTEKSVLNKDNASESIKGDDTAKSTRSAHPLKFITGVDIAKSFMSKKDLKMLSESDSAAEVDIPISLSKTDDGKSSISKGEIAQVVKSVTTANANRSELVSCMTDSSKVKVSGSDTGKTSDSVTNGETTVTRESDEMTLVTKANSMITSHAIASSEMLSFTKSGIGNAPATQLSIAEGALATVSDGKTLAFTNIGKLAVTSAGNVNTVLPTSFTGNTIANTGSTEEIHVTTSSGEIQVTTAGSGKLDKAGSFVKTEDTTATTGKTAITTVRIGKTAVTTVTNEETLTPSASTGTTTFRACSKETAVSKASTEEASVFTASTGKTAVGTVITGMLEVTTASTEETDITTASTRKTNLITVSTEKPEVTTASTEETRVATTNSGNTMVSTVNTVKPKVTTRSTKETAVTKVSTRKPAVTELSNRKTNITTVSAEETAVTIAGARKTTVIALNTEKPKVTTAVTGETAVSSVTPGKPKVTTASTEKRTVATVSTGKPEISTASTKETFVTANTGKTTVSTVSIGEPVVTTARTEDVTVTTASSRKPTDVTVSTGKPKDTTSPCETAVTTLSTGKTAVTTMSIGKPKVITEGTGKPKVTTISTGGTIGITAGTVKPKVTTGSTGKTPVITASTGKPKVTTVSHEETTVTIANAEKTAVTTASIGKTAVATVSMGKPKVTTASTGETTVTLACTGKTAVGTTSTGKPKVTTASTGKAVVVIANTGNPTVTAVSTGEAADTTASTRKTTVTTASSGKTVVATANIGKTKVTTASTGETTVTTASIGKTGFATMSAERTKATTANNRKITATTLSTEKAKMTTGSTVKTTVTTVNTGKTRVSTASSGKATFTTLDTGKTVVATANTGETKVTSVSTGETKVTTASTGETTVTTASIVKTGVATMSTEKTKVTTANTRETTGTTASTGKTGVTTMSTEKAKMTTGSTVKTTVTTVNTWKTRVSTASSGKATFTTLDTGKTVVATANTGETKVTSVSTGETKVTTASTGETTVTTASIGKTGVATMSTEKTKVTTANTGETTVTTASTGKTGVATMSTEKTKVTTANTGETTVTTASTGKTGVATTSTEKAKVTTANSRKITATTLSTEKAKVTKGSTVKTAVITANPGKTTVTTASAGKTTFTTLNPGKTVVTNANTGKTKVTTVSTGETTVTTASTGKTGVATMSTEKTKVTTANTGETTVTTASTGKTGVATTSTEKTRVTTANTGETAVTTASTGKTGVATTSTKKAKVTTANDMKITATTLNTEKAKVTTGSTVKTAVTTANSGKTTVTAASTGKTTFTTLNPGKTVVATANAGKTQVTTVSIGETKVTTASTGETSVTTASTGKTGVATTSTEKTRVTTANTGETTVTTASTGKTGVATTSTKKAKVTTANDMKITATTLSTEKAKVTIGSTVKTALTTANSGKTVTTASTGKTTFTTLNPGKTVVATANTGKTKVMTVSTGETKVTTASTGETTVTTASTGKTGVATTSTEKTRVTTANTGETTVTTASTGKTGVATTSTKKANEVTVTILSTEKANVTTGSTVKTAVTTANTGKTPVTTGKTTVTIANTGKTAVTTASIGETTVTTASSRKTTITASTGKTPVATAGTGKIVDVALKSKNAESLVSKSANSKQELIIPVDTESAANAGPLTTTAVVGPFSKKTVSDQLGGDSNNGIIDKRPGDEPFFDHVVIFANALYKHHLEELSCFQVTVITEDNLCFKDVPEAVCRSYSERTKKTLWLLPLGIHSIIEVHPNHDCKRYGCVNQLTTISYEGCIKPSEKDVTDRISDMISHAKLLRETVQRELGPESLVMLVPLIPAAVIQEDAIKDHRVLHSVVSRNNSYSANNAVLSALNTIYNSFCEAWSYLVIKPVKNRLTSLMIEFTKMNQGSNFIFINRDIDDSFVFIPWIKMMKSIIKLALSRCPQGTFGHPRNIKDLNTPSHALPTAGAVPINLPYQVTGSSLKQGQNQAVSLFQQIIVLGNRDISTGLKDLSKYFPIQFEYKNISFDDDGMNTILKYQKKWQDQTLWFILSDLSCLITPVDYEPKCSMFKCPKPVRVFDVKKFGDYPGHTKTTFKSAAENATHLVKEFVASLTEHLEENSAVFLAPVSPFYVIKGDTPSYSHEYLHRIVKADPNIPVVIGRKEDWEEFSFQLKNEWTAMLKSTMSSHAEPIDLLNKYLKSDSKILEFVSTFPRACHSFTQDSWNEVVRGLLIFFANAKMEDWDAEESLCHSDSEFCSEELSGALVTSQEQQNKGLADLQPHNMQSGRSCKEDSNDTSCILSSLSSVQLSAVFSPKQTDDLSVKKQADPPIRQSDTPTKLQLESAKPSVEPFAKEPTVPFIMQETNPLTKLPIKSFGKKPTEFSVEPHARLSEDHLIKHKTDPQARVPTESLTEQSKEPFVKLLGGTSTKLQIEPLSNLQAKPAELSPEATAANRVPNQFSDKYSVKLSEHQSEPRAKMSEESPVKYPRNSSATFAVEHPVCEENVADRTQIEIVPNKRTCKKIFNSDQFSIKTSRKEMRVEAKSDDIILETVEHKFADTVSGNDVGNSEKAVDDSSPSRNDLYQDELDTCNSESRLDERTESRCDFVRALSLEMNNSDKGNSHDKNFRKKEQRYDSVKLNGRNEDKCTLSGQQDHHTKEYFLVRAANISMLPLTFLHKVFQACGALDNGKFDGEDLLFRFKSKKFASLCVAKLNNMRVLDRFLKVKLEDDFLAEEYDYDYQDELAFDAEVEETLRQQGEAMVSSVKEWIETGVNVYNFKVKLCINTKCDSPGLCLNYHTSTDKRRSLDVFEYSDEMCQEMPKRGRCFLKDACPFAHTAVEKDFHVKQFRSLICPGWSKSNFCQKTEEVCPFVHPESPDSFYHDSWQDLYVEGLSNTTIFLVEAFRNMFKLPTASGVQILVITPSNLVARLLKIAVCDLADIFLQTVVTAAHKDMKLDNATVVIGTPSELAAILVTEIEKETHHLSNIRAVIIDDITTILKDSLHPNQLSFISNNILDKSGLNKVVVTEKLGDHEMEVSSDLLRTKFVKVPLEKQKVKLCLSNIKESAVEKLADGIPERFKNCSHSSKGSKRTKCHLSHNLHRKPNSLPSTLPPSERLPATERKSHKRRRSSSSSLESSSARPLFSQVLEKSTKRRSSSSPDTSSSSSSFATTKSSSIKRSCHNFDHETKKLFLVEEKRLKLEHQVDYQTYSDVPEAHPEYEEKYRIFRTKYQKMYAGEDLKECKRLWLRFWEEAMKVELEEVWQSKRAKLVQQFEAIAARKKQTDTAKRKKRRKEKYQEREHRDAASSDLASGVSWEPCEEIIKSRKAMFTGEGEFVSDFPVVNLSCSQNPSDLQEKCITDKTKLPQALATNPLTVRHQTYLQDEDFVSLQHLKDVPVKEMFPCVSGTSQHKSVTCYLSRDEIPLVKEFLSHTLSLLIVLCKSLGILGPAIKIIIHKVLNFGTNTQSALEVLAEEDNVLLMRMASEKLKSLGEKAKGKYKNMLLRGSVQTEKLLEYATASSLTEKKTICGIDVEKVAKATLNKDASYIVKFIENALAYEGIVNPTFEDINEIFLAVSSQHFHMALQS